MKPMKPMKLSKIFLKAAKKVDQGFCSNHKTGVCYLLISGRRGLRSYPARNLFTKVFCAGEDWSYISESCDSEEETKQVRVLCLLFLHWQQKDEESEQRRMLKNLS